MTRPSKVVLDGVVTSTNVGAAQFDFSNDGVLVYMPGGAEDYYSRVSLIDRSGEGQFLDLEPRMYDYVRFSPDGTKLAIYVESANSRIWTLDLSRKAAPRLLPLGPGSHYNPIWDGPDAVVYSSVRGTESKIWRLGLESNEPPRVLFESESGAWPAAISPDRRWLIFERDPSELAKPGIWMLPLDGSGEPEMLVDTPGVGMNAAISRDGRWIAYQSDETGRDEISVVAFPEPGRPIPISSSGGNRPVWSPNADELLYQEGNWIMSVKMNEEVSAGVDFGEPERLFEFEGVAPPTPERKWDISPDGQQFAATEILDRTGTRTELHVVFNWFEELKRLVPVDGD